MAKPLSSNYISCECYWLTSCLFCSLRPPPTFIHHYLNTTPFFSYSLPRQSFFITWPITSCAGIDSFSYTTISCFCFFLVQTGPPLYGVLLPDWIKWAGILLLFSLLLQEHGEGCRPNSLCDSDYCLNRAIYELFQNEDITDSSFTLKCLGLYSQVFSSIQLHWKTCCAFYIVHLTELDWAHCLPQYRCPITANVSCSQVPISGGKIHRRRMEAVSVAYWRPWLKWHKSEANGIQVGPVCLLSHCSYSVYVMVWK